MQEKANKRFKSFEQFNRSVGPPVRYTDLDKRRQEKPQANIFGQFIDRMRVNQ